MGVFHKSHPSIFVGSIHRATYTKISPMSFEFQTDSVTNNFLDNFFQSNGIIPFKGECNLEIPLTSCHLPERAKTAFSGQVNQKHICISSQYEYVLNTLLDFFNEKNIPALRVEKHTLTILLWKIVMHITSNLLM